MKRPYVRVVWLGIRNGLMAIAKLLLLLICFELLTWGSLDGVMIATGYFVPLVFVHYILWGRAYVRNLTQQGNRPGPERFWDCPENARPDDPRSDEIVRVVQSAAEIERMASSQNVLALKRLCS
jgi:hypothetical protein